MRSNSASTTVQYLARTQDEAGYWTDFWLKVGTSDAWVTAYTALLLAEAKPHLTADAAAIADRCLTRAADWLESQRRMSGGWGYNASVAADADSTAWVVMLLAVLDRPLAAATIPFLQSHQTTSGLFRTYTFQSGHAWGQPCVDVSLTCAAALLKTDAWSLAQGQTYWADVIAPCQQPDGSFRGYWWAHPHFPTWLARRLWQQLGKPALCYPWPQLQGAPPFLQACAGGDLAPLWAAQLADGSWEATPILRVPPSHEGLVQMRPNIVPDARRIFTTSTVLRHLADSLIPPTEHQPYKRSSYGRHCDQVLQSVSTACGFDAAQRAGALALFQTLTQYSLATPNAWPAPQLSSLSMGQPLEFSATSGGEGILRYTCEVSAPVLPAAQRVQSGLAALAVTATQIGCRAQWSQLRDVWREIGRSDRHIPAGTRFWVWGGVTQPNVGPTTLKVYASTLHNVAGGGRVRLRRILAAADIPFRGQLQWLCEYLDDVGFPQEIGFGMRGDGKWGVKIYYEFHGWSPRLLANIVAALDFPPTAVAQLTPSIPGVLSEAFARHRRSGLSVRINPRTGDVLELTTTAAFPPHLVPLEVLQARVYAWLEEGGGNFDRYCRALRSADGSEWRMFSLFTQTACRDGSCHATVYLRPELGRPETLVDPESDHQFNTNC